MASYEEEGLCIAIKDLGELQVCVKQYADRTTDVGTYVEYTQEFDAKQLMTVVVAPEMWNGVDIYHTAESVYSLKDSRIPYEWVGVDSHGVEREPGGAGIWAVNKDWESKAPDRIWLDTSNPTQQWVLRDSGTKRTILVMQFMLSKPSSWYAKHRPSGST
jgi:hypothetical protein